MAHTNGAPRPKTEHKEALWYSGGPKSDYFN